MNDSEAKDLMKWTIGLFPSLTTEQTKLLRDEIIHYPIEDARRVIKEHRFLHEFINWPQLRNGLMATKQGRYNQADAYEGEIIRDGQRGQLALKVVGEMSDDDLKVLLDRVLSEMKPELRKFYEGKDPRKFRSLAMSIVDLAAGHDTSGVLPQ